MLEPFHPQKTAAVLQLIEAAILAIEERLYSPRQKQAWLSGIREKNSTQWQQYLTAQSTWLYCQYHQPVGLLSAKADYLDLLFIAPHYQGLGYGKILLQHFLADCGQQTISTHASLAALPFFLSQNFVSNGLSFATRQQIKLPFHKMSWKAST